MIRRLTVDPTFSPDMPPKRGAAKAAASLAPGRSRHTTAAGQESEDMLDQAMPKAFWFMNNHVSIPVSKADGADGTTVMIHTAPFDEAPPLHVHHGEDEIFHVLEGVVRYLVGSRRIEAQKGDTLLAPRGVPHGFRVLSEGGAKILIITRGGFEDMVRSAGRPAEHDDLPQAVQPTPEMQADLRARCAEHQIEILGPPIG